MAKRLVALARIRLDFLHRSATRHGRGFLAAFHSAGQIEGDYLVLPYTTYRELLLRYGGWGDRLHRALKPLVRWLDAHWGTHFVGCSPCARRQQRLNRLEAKIRRLLGWR